MKLIIDDATVDKIKKALEGKAQSIRVYIAGMG